jgi:hypothetical protein
MAPRIGKNLCKTSGKVMYRDLDACDFGARQINRAKLTNGQPEMAMWGYDGCECGRWHLTSHGPYDPDKAQETRVGVLTDKDKRIAVRKTKGNSRAGKPHPTYRDEWS